VELVTARVKLTGQQPQIPLSGIGATELNGKPVAEQKITLPGISEQVSLYSREKLPPDHIIKGPALITETVSTTFVAADWKCCVDSIGNLVLNK
jgi:N-methylhydantoinase A